MQALISFFSVEPGSRGGMIKVIYLFLFLSIAASASTYAGCDVVDAGKRTPFDGKSLHGLFVEKKSLIELNDEYPDLNVIERTFKGEVQTCTDCTERHVVCSK